MAAEQKQKLEQQLWNIATLRGKMDADDFRDYILGFIFYKYLSTKMDLCQQIPKTRRLDLSKLMDT
jgi:type I restriction enzyme M protein